MSKNTAVALPMINRARIAFLSLTLLLATAVSPGQTESTTVVAPVIFVPGILGSKLADDQGLVWGDLSNMIKRFSELELPLKPNKSGLKAAGLLDTIQVFGPFQVSQYEGLLKDLRELGLTEGENLFVFSYDWRQSNFETAEQLKEFVDKVEASKGWRNKKFNMLAHSMGGLIARIYIQKEGGVGHVKRLITLGTPHLGSLEALRTMLLGLGRLKNFVLGGESQIKRVVFSFPSIYELLATYDNCCILGDPSLPRGEKIQLNLLDVENWRRFGWIPAEFEAAPRREFVELAFQRAIALNELMNREFPSEVRHIKVAGDLIDTVGRVYIDKKSGVPIRWDRFGGDGTVMVVSATLRDQVDALVSLQTHPIIFKDDHIRIQLKRALTIDSALEQFGFTEAKRSVLVGPDDELVSVQTIEILKEDSYQETGEASNIQIRIRSDRGEPVNGARIQAWLESMSSGRTQIRVVEEALGNYLGSFLVPSSVDTYRIVVHIPGLGLFEDYFAALSSPSW